MKSIFLLLWFSLINLSLSAQLVPACAGGSPATSCANACINCNFNGYSGSTAGFPSGIVPNFCGTVENAQWMGFIAGAGNATFTVIPSDCADGNGLQIALYKDCMGEPLDCEKGELNGGNIPVSITASLAPGHNYFLMIDGFAGDQCDFSVSVSPNNAVYEPPLGPVGQLTGPLKMCPGATMPFSIPPVFGAGAYIWSGPPGAMIDTMPLPVTVLGTDGNKVNITMGDVGGQICVRAANSCNQTAPCSASLTIEILDQSYRPTIEADTLQHLTCSGLPAELEAQVSASVGFSFAWTADSSGNILSGQNTLKPKVDQTGTYTLLVINGQNGCSSTLSVQVAEPDTPHITDLRLRNITCYGYEDGEVNAAAVEGGRSPYLFSLDGEPFVYAQTFRYLLPGTHTLSLESSDGCRSDTSFTLSQPNEFLMDLGLDTSIHLGQNIQLWSHHSLNEPERMAQVLVKPLELLPMICDTCQYHPTYSFHYTVTAIDSSGCLAIDDRTVTVSKERYVFVPNVFKPELGDNTNAFFNVFGGEDVARIQLFRVINRWGSIVHERTDFLPNDSFAAWDGKVNGQPANPSVFTWQAQILFKDGETEWKSGAVTLVR
ncbi:MAG: hypothetical protein ACKVU0_04930 [Saprospiraceae bacterium]